MPQAGAGIDLVSLRRVRILLKNSGSRIRRVLAPREALCFGRSRIPAGAFARQFAAKEAFLKACHDPTLELSEIEVKILPQDRFRVKSLRSSGSTSFREGEGCFFHASSHVGALIILWNP